LVLESYRDPAGARVEVRYRLRWSEIPLVTMRRIGARYFARITLSARELDDTRRQEGQGVSPFVGVRVCDRGG